MNTNHIWIVERLSELGIWEPTVGAALTKVDAKLELQGWNANNPSDRFRITKYGRVTK